MFLNPFRTITALEVASEQLAQAKILHLEMCLLAEQAQSRADAAKRTVERLEKYFQELAPTA